jgi:hypothetical protein
VVGAHGSRWRLRLGRDKQRKAREQCESCWFQGVSYSVLFTDRGRNAQEL